MAIADELIALLGFKLDGVGDAKEYERIVGRLNSRLEKFATTAGKYIAAGAAALAGGTALFGKSVIDTSAQFEVFQATLETIEGSSEKARQSLLWLNNFAKTTPYNIEDVTKAFVKLKAYGIDPIADNTLQVLGDTASAMGKRLDQAVEALADAQTGEFERLKEFGVKAKTKGDQITFNWSQNGKDMSKTVTKTATEIRNTLLGIFSDRFAGGMARQAKTFNGIMSNIQDTWTDFKRRIGEAGFFENVSKKLQELLDYLTKLDQDGKIDRWARSVSGALSQVADVLWAFATRFAVDAQYLAEHLDQLRPYLIALAGLMGMLVVRAFPLISALILVGLVIDDFISYMKGGESVIGDFIAAIQKLTGVSEGVAQALTGLGGAVAAGLLGALFLRPIAMIRGLGGILLGLVSGFFLPLASILFNGFSLLVNMVGSLLFRGIIALAPLLGQALAALFAFLLTPVGWAVILAGIGAALVWYFWDDLVAAWPGFQAKVVELFNQIKSWFTEIDWTGAGVAMMTAIWNGMKSIGQAIKDWFMSLIPGWAMKFIGGSTSLPTGASDAATNVQGNLSRTGADRATAATVNDNRADNRQYPMEVNTTINQQVQQATDAPRAAAEATAGAVTGAVARQRTQVETEPHF